MPGLSISVCTFSPLFAWNPFLFLPPTLHHFLSLPPSIPPILPPHRLTHSHSLPLPFFLALYHSFSRVMIVLIILPIKNIISLSLSLSLSHSLTHSFSLTLFLTSLVKYRYYTAKASGVQLCFDQKSDGGVGESELADDRADWMLSAAHREHPPLSHLRHVHTRISPFCQF